MNPHRRRIVTRPASPVSLYRHLPPRPAGQLNDHVVLGGTLIEGDENPEPTPALAEQILRRCIEVGSRLRRRQPS